MIQEFLRENFGITKARFGTNGYELAKLRQLFYQYPNQCNVTVSLGIFWAGVGYERIHRLAPTVERVIFCKLQRYIFEEKKPEIALKVHDEEEPDHQEPFLLTFSPEYVVLTELSGIMRA